MAKTSAIKFHPESVQTLLEDFERCIKLLSIFPKFHMVTSVTYCKLQNCKVLKRNNKGKCNALLFKRYVGTA